MALLLLAALTLAREPILLALGDFLVVQDELQPSDLIAVVSGNPKRVEYGIDLYRQGYAPALFFTGGWSEYYQMSYAERYRQRALDRGVPNEAIYTDSHPLTSTYSEAERLKYFLDHQANRVRRRCRKIYNTCYGIDA
jgi:uncharacterized SAM-binding protein YcdF (DUF218 family)